MKLLRRYLVAGLLIWAPLAVTFLLLRFAVNIMDKTLAIIPQQYRPEDRQRFMEYIQQDAMAAAQLRAPMYED